MAVAYLSISSLTTKQNLASWAYFCNKTAQIITKIAKKTKTVQFNQLHLIRVSQTRNVRASALGGTALSGCSYDELRQHCDSQM